jgi:hypothetical protein
MDPSTRLSLLGALEKESDGKLALFFASYELGDAYAAPGRYASKASRVASAMKVAGRQERGDDILAAAARHFQLAEAKSGDAEFSAGEVDDFSTWLDGSTGQNAVETAHEGDDDMELRRLAFEAWDESGEWPVARTVQRRIERDGGGLDVEVSGRRLDARMGFLEQTTGGRVILRVVGLSDIAGAEICVSDFIKSIQLAYRLYAEDPAEPPVLSDQTLQVELGLDPERSWRMYTLLDGESFLLEGGNSSPEQKTFRRDISPNIRHFRSVRSIADYRRAADEFLGRSKGATTTTTSSPPDQGLVERRRSGNTEPFAGRIAAKGMDRLWDPGMVRLFLSHVSAHKVAVSNLKRELRAYGVSGFVAHEDIEPSLDWQAEIELALRTMDAMAALLTPEFHESKWTDQEIGIALGLGVFVLPVRLPINPSGFVAKSQGLRGDLTKPVELASLVVDILLKRSETHDAMREGLVVGLESAASYAISKLVSTKIVSASGFTSAQLGRIESSIAGNDQVGESTGVPERLRRFVASTAPGASS